MDISTLVSAALSGLWDIVKLAAAAVLGVLTFIVGQIFMKLAEPALALRGQIGIINGGLLMYANKSERIAAPDERSKIYRKHAAKLNELAALIVPYVVFSKLLNLPRKERVLEAATQLIGLSNAQISDEMGSGWYLGRYIEALLGTHTLTAADRDALSRQNITVMPGF
jgi:hypothetical protein